MKNIYLVLGLSLVLSGCATYFGQVDNGLDSAIHNDLSDIRFKLKEFKEIYYYSNLDFPDNSPVIVVEGKEDNKEGFFEHVDRTKVSKVMCENLNRTFNLVPKVNIYLVSNGLYLHARKYGEKMELTKTSCEK